MPNSLRALILGSGYAGEGHTLALRRAGVDVVAMAGRTESAVRAAAERLNIPHAGTEWRQMIAELRPDIVAVGTPGGAHLEQCLGAIEAGCHVLCDKPLAATAADARQIYAAAKAKGIKSAYAASYRYQPQALTARELVQNGRLGQIYEVECISHYNLPRMMPFGWPHRLDQGGGRLNNNFTHKLAIVQQVVGGEILAAMGETRNDLKRAPVGERVHDFREYSRRAGDMAQSGVHEWAEVDSDWSYTVLVRLGVRGAALADTTSATFHHSALSFAKNKDYVAFYGEKGVLHIEGAYAQGDLFLRTDGETWDSVSIPDQIRNSLPPETDHSQRNWDQLAREFVADIQGQGDGGYQTFRDGWIYQEVIDTARGDSGWTPIAGDI
ncbi:MAG: Gfo/Idh/MocA family oxidoreductase [Caldilineaceae bacterium]|nr:Gfo/Idh/MocA family oxidoreductase [Caldilineaceae bacterium]